MDRSLEGLRPVLRGDLVTPHDPDYDRARKVWNGAIDRRPRGIVRCRGVADVIAGVRFVTAENLHCSVRAGGHGVAGTAVCDDGIVLDLSGMRSIRIDPWRRCARVEAGALWAELNLESQAFSLVTGLQLLAHLGSGTFLGGRADTPQKRTLGTSDKAIDPGSLARERCHAGRAEPNACRWLVRCRNGNADPLPGSQ